MIYAKSRQLLDSLFASGREVTYERRETIVAYNQESPVICRVIEGCVKVMSYTGSGNERIHYLYSAGDVFPMERLLDLTSAEIGFIAVTQVRVQVMPLENIRTALIEHPLAMLTLLKQQAGLYSWIVNLNLDSAEQRLAYRLLGLGTRFGVANGDHLMIALPLTIQELADMVRLTRETTGKVLSQFEQKGYIILGRQQILVYPDLLKGALEGPLAGTSFGSHLAAGGGRGTIQKLNN